MSQKKDKKSFQNILSMLMIPAILLAAIFSFFLLTAGVCSGPIEPGSRGACEKCGDDEDCEDGLTCQTFHNSQVITQLCAKSGTRTCSIGSLGEVVYIKEIYEQKIEQDKQLEK